MILEAYLNAKYVQLESYEYIERDGVYQLPSEDETRLILREYLDIPYAKVWWSRHREHVFSLGRSETARLRRPSVSSRTATISGPVRQAKSTQQTARTGLDAKNLIRWNETFQLIEPVKYNNEFGVGFGDVLDHQKSPAIGGNIVRAREIRFDGEQSLRSPNWRR